MWAVVRGLTSVVVIFLKYLDFIVKITVTFQT